MWIARLGLGLCFGPRLDSVSVVDLLADESLQLNFGSDLVHHGLADSLSGLVSPHERFQFRQHLRDHGVVEALSRIAWRSHSRHVHQSDFARLAVNP